MSDDDPKSAALYVFAITCALIAALLLWTNGPPCEEDASLCAINSEAS